MAKMNDIKIKIDDFLTKTRVKACLNLHCKYLDSNTGVCEFKEIVINTDGLCANYEPIEKEKYS